jgi:hypothetical protein
MNQSQATNIIQTASKFIDEAISSVKVGKIDKARDR